MKGKILLFDILENHWKLYIYVFLHITTNTNSQYVHELHSMTNTNYEFRYLAKTQTFLSIRKNQKNFLKQTPFAHQTNTKFLRKDLFK